MTQSRHLEIRRLPIEELKPAPYNPRRLPKPGDPAYRKLAASLREFGLVEPLIWNETTGHVVGGHLRLQILREMGVAEVPVSVVQLDPLRERALNVVLNNREAQGRFDPEKLASLLDELAGLPELPLTGFNPLDLKLLRYEPLGSIAAESPRGTVEVILETDAATFLRMLSQLEGMVREFELTCHVTHR
jgi:ParB-like chromosome segregation protein Spo0J